MREFCTPAFDYVGLKANDHVEIDPRFLRPVEVGLLDGNPAKAGAKLGGEAHTSLEQLVVEMIDADMDWTPEAVHDFETTLADVLCDCRKRLIDPKVGSLKYLPA